MIDGSSFQDALTDWYEKQHPVSQDTDKSQYRIVQNGNSFKVEKLGLFGEMGLKCSSFFSSDKVLSSREVIQLASDQGIESLLKVKEVLNSMREGLEEHEGKGEEAFMLAELDRRIAVTSWSLDDIKVEVKQFGNEMWKYDLDSLKILEQRMDQIKSDRLGKMKAELNKMTAELNKMKTELDQLPNDIDLVSKIGDLINEIRKEEEVYEKYFNLLDFAKKVKDSSSLSDTDFENLTNNPPKGIQASAYNELVQAAEKNRLKSND